MAVVGDQLLTPESGWQRLDGTNSKILKTGSGWLSGSYGSGGSDYFNNTYLFNDSIVDASRTLTFAFYGSKFRILEKTDAGYGGIVQITIDGIDYTYSNLYSNLTYRITYEKLDLSLGMHNVTIKLLSTTANPRFGVDSIDIDSTGYLTAAVGTQVLTPESGWQRIDGGDTKIKKLGTWNIGSSGSGGSEYFNDTYVNYYQSSPGYLAFRFYGSKLRIIDVVAPANNSYSPAVNINIDGVDYVYKQFNNDVPVQYYTLLFEKLNLPLAMHNVVIRNLTPGTNSGLDCIDIDSSGHLANVTILNPYDKASPITLTNDLLNSKNTDITNPRRHMVRALNGRSTGKWYWEVTMGASQTWTSNYVDCQVGVTNASELLTDANWNFTTKKRWAKLGGSGASGYYFCYNQTTAQYGSPAQVGDVIGVALNLDSNPKTITWYLNGVLDHTSNTITNEIIYPMLGDGDLTINFGNIPYAYPAPAGYDSWDDANLGPVTKHLFKDMSSGNIYSFVSNVLTLVGNGAITEQMMLDYGIDNTSTMTQTQLQQLSSFRVYTYKT